jgi:hypothetical protein
LTEIDLEPPALLGSGGLQRFELVRLLTYDLGFWVNVTYERKEEQGRPVRHVNISIESDKWRFIPHRLDVGPFAMKYALSAYPQTFMLTPGTAPFLYGWYYEEIAKALAPLNPEIGTTYVVGYSFPAYDRPFLDFLRSTFDWRSTRSIHVVNPAFAQLPVQTLKNIFGSYESHPCGFEEMDWAQVADPTSKFSGRKKRRR